MNLGSYVSRSAMFWPEQEALVCEERRWTYRQLDQRTNRLADCLLAHGLRSGDAVATYSSNRAELVEVEVALYKAGLLRVPINYRLGTDEAAHVLEDAEVQVLFADAQHADSAKKAIAASGCAVDLIVFDAGDPEDSAYEEVLARGSEVEVEVEVELDAPSVLHFTSGSTGKLKAAVQTTGNRLANMRKRLMTPDWPPSTEDRYLVAGPITHASGMGMLASLSRGATIVVLPRWSAQAFFSTVATEKITSTFLVPTMLNMVLNDQTAASANLSSLKCVRVGGAPVSPQRLREAVDLFGPIVVQGYGQGETTSGVTLLTSEDIVRGIESDPEILLSCGRAVFDTQVRVVDDNLQPVATGEKGELVVRGPDCATRYWNEPELSAETFKQGWVMTGDIAYIRDDGYVIIVDRKKDMIISGGFNIYCSEVEVALYEHPSVGEVCVVGVPDEQWGESVKALVVLKPTQTASETELIDFCATRLDSFKKPRSVEFVDDLPVNRNGKIDRKQVRQRFWSADQRAVN